MKIQDIEYRTLKEVNEMERFDLKSMPKRAKWYLQVLAWLLSIPETFFRKVKIIKVNMDKVKSPYVLLCNHNSFFDFKVATRALFPRRANYVVAVDGFINRESLMRNVGCLGKRKFVSDPAIVKQLKHTLEVNKSIAVIYPEARYSLIGTTAILPESLGKLIKMFKYPVVTLISHGHHLHEPVWNLIKRKVPVKSVMTYLFSKDDLENLSLQEVNNRLKEAFYYNDYEYQINNDIKIKGNNRAKNLHKVLYRCPHCLSDFTMNSENNNLFCDNCHHNYYVDEHNRLNETNGETLFNFIPDWFEWQRSEVRKEIDNGKYNIITPSKDVFDQENLKFMSEISVKNNLFSTPILLIIFNRPEKLKGLMEILSKIKPEKLYISADGPRKDNQNDIELCRRAREIATNVDWPCEIHTNFATENLGLGGNGG
ncbi:MAG: hypothetical protein RQ856_06780, partial [Candidatus Izemoplasmatales bacterium]|nr:hypothetical protein [Candidatus Izemoplasmatales bacterium]